MKEIFEAKMREITHAMMNRYGVFDFEMPVLLFKKIGKTAGRAFFKRNLIIINPDYLGTEYENMLNRTLPHEVAHIVAYKVFGDHGHGQGWRKVMRDHGLEPERCHDYDTAPAQLRKTRKFEYICPRCSQKFTIGACVHRKSMNNETYRIHVKCNMRIVFTGNEC